MMDPNAVAPTPLAEIQQVLAPEPDDVAAARARAGTAISTPDPAVGALLAWAVVTTGARAVVEVGAAAGVSGLWLLQELPDAGVLTSIESDPHAHALATDAYAAAAASTRVRSILGQPATVLPRLSDQAYDLALLQGSPALTSDVLEHVRRLLRPGGLLLVRGLLRAGEQAEPLALALQELGADPAFAATSLPIGDGLVLATRLPAQDA